MRKITTVIISVCFALSVSADEIIHKFKSPSFSGIGQSAHYLTIENQEKSRRDKTSRERSREYNACKISQKCGK